MTDSFQLAGGRRAGNTSLWLSPASFPHLCNNARECHERIKASLIQARISVKVALRPGCR